MSPQLLLQPDNAGIDTHLVDESYTNVNSGSSTESLIGTATIDKATVRFRFLVRFDLSSIPLEAVIVSATLTLSRVASVLAEGAAFRAHRLTRGDWTEFGATWNKLDGAEDWVTPGGDFTVDGQLSLPVLPGGNLVFHVVELVEDAVDSRGGQLDLILRGPESGTVNFMTVATSDNATAALRPRLVVEYGLRPQLAISDHGDGSGATVTVSGTDPDGTTTIFYRGFSGEMGSATWTAAGSMVGNGDVELALPPGHYFAYAGSSSGGVQVPSAVEYFVVSDGLESTHSRCLAAVQARVRLLALEGLSSEQVVIEKVPAGRNLASDVGLPAVVISPRRAAMPAEEGTNRSDDVEYDVLVSIFDRDNQEPTLAANLDRHLLWRQQIAKAFRNQRLAGVSEIINTQVEPGEGLLPEAWQKQLMASAVLLRFTSREPRGF